MPNIQNHAAQCNTCCSAKASSSSYVAGFRYLDHISTYP